MSWLPDEKQVLKAMAIGALLAFCVMAQELNKPPAPAPGPTSIDCPDRLSVRDIQISLLREAVKLKDKELVLLRTQLDYQRSLLDAWRLDAKLNGQLDSRHSAIYRKYGADPADYKLTFDMGWEKIDHSKHVPKQAPANIHEREEEDEKAEKVKR